MEINSIWNKKIGGIIPAFCMSIFIMLDKIANGFASFVFRHNIASCGKNVKVTQGLTYRYPGQLYVGDEVIIGHGTSLTSENLPESKLVIKNHVSIGDGCNIDFTGGVTIEDGAHLAHNVRIISHDHGYNYKSVPVGKSLTIGRNSFVGSGVIILFNCSSIGENAVIGTGSVVTKDIPTNAVVAGNPAKIIKYRDDI